MFASLPLAPLSASANRQDVCVFFADVVGSTMLAHDMPLEKYAALMTELLQVLILSCAARGGEVLQHQGDAVVSVWPGRHTPYALEAASEAHGRVADLAVAAKFGVRLQLRIGLASGEVVMGTVGGSLTAYGLPVNLSRRLCDASEPGGTLVCADTQLLAPDASYRLMSTLELQGFPALRGAARLMASPSLTRMKIS